MMTRKLLGDGFNLERALAETCEVGYFFASGAISPYFCSLMQTEIRQINLEEGDHVNYPINAGTLREVQQLHQRAYFPVGHPEIPIATEVTRSLAHDVGNLIPCYPELENWCPTEAGYQRYRDSHDWISPHRDRRNDQLLSATITISGSALVRIYEPLDNPDDYTKLGQTDQFLTQSGTLLLLRAPGFGTGEQTIHEVLSPLIGSRTILNLRMRPDILKNPRAFEEKRKE